MAAWPEETEAALAGVVPLCQGQEQLGVGGRAFWVRRELLEEGTEGAGGGGPSPSSPGVELIEKERQWAGNRDPAVGLSFGAGDGMEERELGQLYGPLNTHELAIKGGSGRQGGLVKGDIVSSSREEGGWSPREMARLQCE